MSERDGVPIDNEVDSYDERLIDRFMQGAVGAATGAAMTGLGKSLGMGVEPEEVAVIREAGAPPRDEEDPIEVSIDPDHPENTRIVYHVQAKGEQPAPSATSD